MTSNLSFAVAAAFAIGVLASGCSPGPEPIHYGEDQCAHCRMAISDARYAGQIVTSKGRVLKFDAIECMARHASEVPVAKRHSVWAMDVRAPGDLANVTDLRFVRNDSLRTPMGGGVVGFRGSAPATGPVMNWTEVVKHFDVKARAETEVEPPTVASH